MITAVVTRFKRGKYYNEQIGALYNQTLRPTEIIVCDNRKDNRGVWQRFADALLAKNEYIFIVDDDVIPGEFWLENCYNQILKEPALYPCTGVIFEDPNVMGEIGHDGRMYKVYQTKYGSEGSEMCTYNTENKIVDYGIQSYFFKKDWLQYFWETPFDPSMKFYGEDFNLAFKLQKYGIPTISPAVDPSNKKTWGNTKPKYNFIEGLWPDNKNDQHRKTQKLYAHLRKNGFGIIKFPEATLI